VDEVSIWDAAASKSLFRFPVPASDRSAVRCLAFSSKGRYLATGFGVLEARPAGVNHFGGVVQVWDANTGQAVVTLRRHASPVLSIAFSPDGMRLASGSDHIEQAIKV
jgi:WD40 repeat protein